jgi:hypothetical protein
MGVEDLLNHGTGHVGGPIYRKSPDFDYPYDRFEM